MHTDSLVINGKTKDIIKHLKNLEDLFEFSNLDENHEIFSNKNQKMVILKMKLLRVFGLMKLFV